MISTCLDFSKFKSIHTNLKFFSEVSEKVLSGSRNGTYVTVSKITLPKRATPGDDGTNIICKAEHPALISSEIYPHLEDAGTLSILCKYALVNNLNLGNKCMR